MEGWPARALVYCALQFGMKKSLEVFAYVALALIALGTVAFLISPLANWRGYHRYRMFCPGCDFTLRMNEVECVRQGYDPLDIWGEKRFLPPYVSSFSDDKRNIWEHEPVNAYTPWEYAYMMPLSFLPRRVAWGVYVAFMFACLIVLLRLSRKQEGPLVAALSLLLVVYPVWSNFFAGNFAVPLLFAAFMMAWLLNRGHDALAGVAWALLMTKPQLGLLFAVPLLWRGKIVTCVVAASICLAASLVPAALCSTSPLKLIFDAPSANTACFSGSGTLPWCLCGLLSRNAEIVLSCVIGFAVCFFMTWCLRREKDWFLFFMPAAICAPNWTYTQSCSFAFGWFFFFAILRDLRRNPQSTTLRVFLLLAILVVSRAYVAIYNGIGFCHLSAPYSQDVHLTIDSLNSTASLLLALAFCVWRGRLGSPRKSCS